MRQIQTIIRACQRLTLDLKSSLRITKIRYVVLLSLLLVLSSFLFIYKDESYQYTSGSLQKISDKITLLSNKIDSFNMIENYRQETIVPETPTTTIDAVTISDVTTTQTTEANVSPTEADALPSESEYPRENGVILVFARNIDLYKLTETMWSVEQRFNKKYKYNWLIVSDALHNRNFKATVLSLSSGNVEFAKVPRLTYPPNIDKARMKDSRKAFRQQSIVFRKTIKMRHQQRFWAKDILFIEQLAKYDYFMRIDPGVLLYCDVNFDFFKFMTEHQRTYGFGFAMKGKQGTFPSLWDDTLAYIKENPKDIHENNMIDFISDDKGETFNTCQFRANFEVGDLRFFRSDKYKKLAEYLDNKNGIYYEGWDESTFHTLGVALLEDRHKIQFFNNIGYNDRASDNLKSCPFDESIRLGSNCVCNPLDDLTWNSNAGSCIDKFFHVNSFQVPTYAQDSNNAIIEAEEAKKNADEKKKYEQEQLNKEKQKEEEERKKIEEQEKKKEEVSENKNEKKDGAGN